jgi:hypothetical protein
MDDEYRNSSQTEQSPMELSTLAGFWAETRPFGNLARLFATRDQGAFLLAWPALAMVLSHKDSGWQR